MNENIKLINHSSLYLNCNENVRILSDPWYDGFAFDGGWSLLYHNEVSSIENLLNNTDYIYISHEHPDHFSISFFKKFLKLIKEKKIKILFQKTSDKRVEKFLSEKLNLEVIILENFKTIEISGQKITLISCGSIDSSLIVETDNCYHINLNDCDFINKELKRIKKFLKNKKKIIIYLQFSYATHRSDEEWLKKAAEFKLKNLVNVYNIFNADLIIPFASFIYFSNSENFHLNKHMNNVEITSKFLTLNRINHCMLNPELAEINIEKLINNEEERIKITKSSSKFWDYKFKNIKPKNEINNISEISDETKTDFLKRIKNQNSLSLLFFIRLISFKYFFGDIVFHLKDTNEIYKVNFFKITKVENFLIEKIDIEMFSRRFYFLLKYPYGIETLSVNGCFFEKKKNSFEKMIRSLGFISLNQTNNGITISSIFTRNIINKIFSTFLRLKLKNS